MAGLAVLVAARAGGGAVASGPPSSPGLFASADLVGNYTDIDLRSASTGRVVKRLARFGQRFTNNGLAMSPDGRDVYVTLIPRQKHLRGLLIDRVSVAGGARVVSAVGDQPSLSPSGRFLAYQSMAGPPSVFVKDLVNGKVRSLEISRLLRRSEALLEARPAWSGDGTELAFGIGGRVVAISGDPGRRAATIAKRAPAASLLLVSVGDDQQPLRARRASVHGVRGEFFSMWSDGSAVDSILATTFGPRDTTNVFEVKLASPSASAHRLLGLSGDLILAFDTSARRLLYLHGHSPPALWRATVGGGRLIDRRRLFKRSPVGDVSW